jgi:uridine kinase
MTGAPRRLSSFEDLVAWLLREACPRGREDGCSLVLVGGCSRAGKSVLARRIAAALSAPGRRAEAVSLDAWILDVARRAPGSLVAERFECDRIVREVLSVLHGGRVHPPEYDPVTRRRVRERRLEALELGSGVLVVEGVVALSLEPLRRAASARLFVDVDDAERKKRVERFYREVKGLPAAEVEELVRCREAEEVPFVKETARHADVVFRADPAEGA